MIKTDSLFNEIKTDDVYGDFHKAKHFFDLRNYPKDSKFFDFPCLVLMIKHIMMIKDIY